MIMINYRQSVKEPMFGEYCMKTIDPLVIICVCGRCFALFAVVLVCSVSMCKLAGSTLAVG